MANQTPAEIVKDARAPRWRRLLATTLDCLVLMFSIQLLVTLVGADDFLAATVIEWDTVAINAGFAVAMILLLFVVPLALTGQTLGKWVLRLRVDPGSPGLKWTTAFRRSMWLVLAYAPGNMILMPLVLLISLFTMFRSGEQKALTDYVAGTTVVRRSLPTPA